MAKAGAQLVGVNCLFDPNILLDVMSDMKQSLELFNLDPYLMIQPLGNDPLLRLLSLQIFLLLWDNEEMNRAICKYSYLICFFYIKKVYYCLGFRCPDGGSYGWVEIPEFPFGRLSSPSTTIGVHLPIISHDKDVAYTDTAPKNWTIYILLSIWKILPFISLASEVQNINILESFGT